MIKTSVLFFFFCFNLSMVAQEARDTSLHLYFKKDSFQLDALQSQRLHDFLSSVSTIKAIIGYADSTGQQSYNVELSKKRAFTVFQAAQTQIDSVDNASVSFKGESLAYYDLWKNRRVQVIAAFSSLSEISDELSGNKTDTVANFFLEYVYFLPDKPIITYESLDYIKKLARDLKTYKAETFEIIGHINYQSRFDSTHLADLYGLSRQRAKAVYDYLAESGIAKSRMTYKGVGNSKPVYPSPVNDEQRRKNMRVQIIITK